MRMESPRLEPKMDENIKERATPEQSSRARTSTTATAFEERLQRAHRVLFKLFTWARGDFEHGRGSYACMQRSKKGQRDWLRKCKSITCTDEFKYDRICMIMSVSLCLQRLCSSIRCDQFRVSHFDRNRFQRRRSKQNRVCANAL